MNLEELKKLEGRVKLGCYYTGCMFQDNSGGYNHLGGCKCVRRLYGDTRVLVGRMLSDIPELIEQLKLSEKLAKKVIEGEHDEECAAFQTFLLPKQDPCTCPIGIAEEYKEEWM